MRAMSRLGLLAMTLVPAATAHGLGPDVGAAPERGLWKPAAIAVVLTVCLIVAAGMPSKRTHRD